MIFSDFLTASNTQKNSDSRRPAINRQGSQKPLHTAEKAMLTLDETEAYQLIDNATKFASNTREYNLEKEKEYICANDRTNICDVGNAKRSKTAAGQPKIEKAAVINILKDRQPEKAKSVITAESVNQKTALPRPSPRWRIDEGSSRARHRRSGGARLVQQ